jgi:hypothetical protein
MQAYELQMICVGMEVISLIHNHLSKTDILI